MRTTYGFRNQGQKQVEEGLWRHNVSKRQGHVVAFLYDIPYLTLLATIIHPVEGYDGEPPRDIRLLQTLGSPNLNLSVPPLRLV
jgi:hypothetical protein